MILSYFNIQICVCIYLLSWPKIYILCQTFKFAWLFIYSGQFSVKHLQEKVDVVLGNPSSKHSD